MKVTATIQAPDNDPVEMVWAKDTDAMGVMLCMAQLLNQPDDHITGVKTLAIHVEL